MARYRHKTSQRKSAPDLSGISTAALIAEREKLLIRRKFLHRNHQAAEMLCNKFQHGISKLEQKILTLQGNPTNRASFAGMFRNGLTAEAKSIYDDLVLQVAKLREKLDGKPYRLEGTEYQSLRRMVIQLFNDIQFVDRRIDQVSASLRRTHKERQKAHAAEKKRAKAEQRDAMAKAYVDKTREQADIVRRRLHRDHPCPYCFRELDARAHADHIHPVSRGGLSTVRNMVYACSECNQLKADLTLFRFIGKFKRNAEQIFRNLHALGKDF